MPLTRTAEQAMYADVVRRFFELRTPSAPDAMRAVESDWTRLCADLGATGLPLPEPIGSDGTWREVAIVLEAAGSALSPLPYLSSMIAVRLLEGLGAEATGAELAAAARGTRFVLAVPASAFVDYTPLPIWQDGRLTGTVPAVLDAAYADRLLVPVRRGSSVAVVDVAAADVRISHRASLDLTRSLDDVHLADVLCRRLGVSVDASDPMREALLFANVAVAADCVGGAQRCLDRTVDYVKMREQFGRPVGSMQAVKHALADVLRELEPARAAVRDAVDALCLASSDLDKRTSVARLSAVAAYVSAAGTAIQLHGAVGFTWELELHQHFKRAVTARALFGTAAQHRAVLAGHLCAEARTELDERWSA